LQQLLHLPLTTWLSQVAAAVDQELAAVEVQVVIAPLLGLLVAVHLQKVLSL